MKPDEELRARELYRRWFAEHPGQVNPTDINTVEKYRFAMSIGWRDFRLMQNARKSGLEFSKPHMGRKVVGA